MRKIQKSTRLSDSPYEARLWLKFVTDNVKCYHVNFIQLIRRMLRVKLSQTENAYMFMRLAKIFNHRQLQDMIREAVQKQNAQGGGQQVRNIIDFILYYITNPTECFGYYMFHFY